MNTTQALDFNFNQLQPGEIELALELIGSELPPANAKEQLLTLLGNQLGYHSTKILSREESLGTKENPSRQKRDEIVRFRNDFLNLLNKAKQSGKTLRVENQVRVYIAD